MATWTLVVLLASGLCITAVVFLFYGAAEGLGLWLQKPWLGYVITGGSLLFLLLFSLWLVARGRRIEARRLEKKAEKATEEFKESIKTLAPLEWTREHPWTSTGAAAAAGFVVAGAVTAAPNSPRTASAAKTGPATTGAPPANEPSIVMSALVSTAMSVLKGALTPIVMDFVKDLNLSEIFGVNLEGRAQDRQDDGPHQQSDRPEDGQPSENA